MNQIRSSITTGSLTLTPAPLTTTTINALMRESDGRITTNANLVDLAGTQVLTNKSLTSPTITGSGGITAGPVSAGSLIISNTPFTTTTINALIRESNGVINTNADLVDKTSTQTLTNKILVAANNTITIGGSNVTSLINQDVRSTATPTFASITLPAPGGTPIALDYYEYAPTTSTYTGIWASAQNCTIAMQRVGKLITIYGSEAFATSNTASLVSLTFTLPARFRPSTTYCTTTDQYATIGTAIESRTLICKRAASYTSGQILVGTGGVVKFYAQVNASNFAGNGTNEGISAWSLSYFIP